MAFTGFNFRGSSGGGTGFAGNGAGNTYVPNFTDGGCVYSAGQGYGWASAALTPYGGNASNATGWDGRVAGFAIGSSASHVFRVDVPNGEYKLRLAVGAVPNSSAGAQHVIVRYGSGPGEKFEITATSAALPTSKVMDAQGGIHDNAAWDDDQQDRTVTVTRGYITVEKGATGGLSLRHFAYELVPSPLRDVTLRTDDTNWTKATTGTTGAADAVIIGIPATTGLAPGMRVWGEALPAGGASVASVDSYGQVTLTSGAGVTALVGGALTFGHPISLYERSPPDKLVAPITAVNGASNFAVYGADGVTPSPYLKVRSYAGTYWLAYTDEPLTGVGASYAFKVRQTDTSGIFTGSPHDTAFTISVIAAADKPVDDSLLGRISTPCYQLRETIREAFAVDWPGYEGQTFVGTYEANSLATLKSRLDACVPAAGAWFNIQLTDETLGGVAADWVSHLLASGSSWNFLPELGGGVLITNKAGQSPYVKGSWYTGALRGAHFLNLNWTSHAAAATAALRLDSFGATNTLIRIEGCRFGFLNDPAYSDPPNDIRANLDKAVNAVTLGGKAEQVTVLGCSFKGVGAGVQTIRARRFRFGWNDVSYMLDDVTCGHAMDPFTDSGLYGGDLDQHVWLHDNLIHGSADVVDLYGFRREAAYDLTGKTGDTTSGSLLVTNISDMTGIAAGMTLKGASLPVNGVVVTGVDVGNSQLTLATSQGVSTGSGVGLTFNWGNTYDGPHVDFHQERATHNTRTGATTTAGNAVVTLAAPPASATGATSVGSPVITGVAAPISAKVGMQAWGATLPAGAVVQGVNAAAGTITLASGVGVTAGTGVALTFSDAVPNMRVWASTLPEDGRLIQSASSATQFTLESGDGVTAGTNFSINLRHKDAGTVYKLVENNTVAIKSLISVKAQNGARVWSDIQFMIATGLLSQSNVVINNLLAHSTVRGIDVGGLADSYVECNTLLCAPVLPDVSEPGVRSTPRISAAPGVGVQGLHKARSRLNVTSGYTGIGTLLFAEDDAVVSYLESETPDPDTVMTGPFTADARGRWTFDLSDLPADDPRDVRTALYGVAKPLEGVRAGVVSVRLLAFESTLADWQSDALAIVSAGMPDSLHLDGRKLGDGRRDPTEVSLNVGRPTETL